MHFMSNAQKHFERKMEHNTLRPTNYEKSGDIKYLNIGREDDVTASIGKWFHRGITVCIEECCKKVVRAKGIL